MLTAYTCDGPGLRPVTLAPGEPLPSRAVWVDLLRPSDEEEAVLEKDLGINIPTLDEMKEIEASSRLYEEAGAFFMTAIILARSNTDYPESGAVTFILARDRLVTVRYIEPHSFQVFLGRAERHPALCGSGQGVLLGLLETVVDRIADLLERISTEVDGVSRTVFAGRQRRGRREKVDYQGILRDIGRYTDVVSRAHESILSIDRLVTYQNEACPGDTERETRGRYKVLRRDLVSLRDYATALVNKTTFLLDATLGMVSIEQNDIIKIFSVAAVAFLPPTLIASIYGMNFEHMPELKWQLGYPLALLLMLISAILPFFYFKRRGWL